MYYEIRTYTFKPSRAPQWIALYKAEALPIQLELLGKLIGFFTTEIGDINQVVHIWGYDSLDDRVARRDRMAADPRWQAWGKKTRELDLLQSMETRIMRATDFSPLQ
ncbi:NIPSNAP family protein [Pseudomonas sp. HR96]|uniref:NIPSNAP family protein n=1 Tax=Pseudomonas sp. HR96 TaxID=1027966 RepID=UPI002A75B818|nr:NIPSNAP family protein [Pseudomonas sp. HR96]WPO99676.1 NIPSNAP family protein [Pseudomonas sp. HR96]